MTYDPDPLYVPGPDSDEAHYEAAAAYFERLEFGQQDQGEMRDRGLLWGFAFVIVMLALIAAALLIGGGR